MKTINDVIELANELLNKEFTFTTYYGTHNVSAKSIGYRFEFNNRKRAFGVCYYNQKKISLSLPLCTENLDKVDSRIYNTILHEIAHALCVYVYGIKQGKGHGSCWRSIATQIGCDGKRCFESETVNLPKGKYSLICDNCGRETQKHRKVTRQYACGKCCNAHNGGKFSTKFILRLVVNNLELSK
jgi:predicted SprT family Zn-dependent metalloprotease